MCAGVRTSVLRFLACMSCVVGDVYCAHLFSSSFLIVLYSVCALCHWQHAPSLVSIAVSSSCMLACILISYVLLSVRIPFYSSSHFCVCLPFLGTSFRRTDSESKYL